MCNAARILNLFTVYYETGGRRSTEAPSPLPHSTHKRTRRNVDKPWRGYEPSDEPEDALGAHVEEQVEHAEVGQEAVARGKHLVVRARLKVGVGLRVLGVDGVAEVGNG